MRFLICVPVTGQDAEIEIVKVPDPGVLVLSDVSAIALDFKVLHPVVITRLGVFPSGTRPELQSNVTVKLLQLDQEVTEPLSGNAALGDPELQRRTSAPSERLHSRVLKVDHAANSSQTKRRVFLRVCRRLWLRLASVPSAPGPWRTGCGTNPWSSSSCLRSSSSNTQPRRPQGSGVEPLQAQTWLKTSEFVFLVNSKK